MRVSDVMGKCSPVCSICLDTDPVHFSVSISFPWLIPLFLLWQTTFHYVLFKSVLSVLRRQQFKLFLITEAMSSYPDLEGPIPKIAEREFTVHVHSVLGLPPKTATLYSCAAKLNEESTA